MDKIPIFLRKPIFEKLFGIAEYANLTKAEKMMYDSSLKYKWDNKNVLDYARKEGIEEGRKEGRKEGIEKGKQEAMYAIVSNLILKLGLSDEQAADVAAVPVDYVAKVRAELKK